MAPQLDPLPARGVLPPIDILQKNNTVTTPNGPITWTQSPDGSVAAEGAGQKLTATGQSGSDGSWQKQVNYARIGQAPYLTMESIGQPAQHQVACTLSAGSSRLTLTITNIDVRVTSGTATLSGNWNGTAVHWTGHADLTTNPLATRPIKGWPATAFTTELRMAAFFAPLGKTLAAPLSAPRPAAPGGVHPMGVGGVLGRAGAWCVGGAIAGAGGAPESGGLSVVLGCAGGATGSLLNDLASWAFDDNGSTEDPMPPIDIPPDPEPIGPITVSSPDDPPPPPSGGDGSGSTGSGDIGGGGDGGGGGGGGGGNLDDSGTDSTHKED